MKVEQLFAQTNNNAEMKGAARQSLPSKEHLLSQRQKEHRQADKQQEGHNRVD